MSSAICLNLDQSKILSSGNDLRIKKKKTYIKMLGYNLDIQTQKQRGKGKENHNFWTKSFWPQNRTPVVYKSFKALLLNLWVL